MPTPPIMWLWRAVVVMPFCNMFAIPCKYYYVVVLYTKKYRNGPISDFGLLYKSCSNITVKLASRKRHLGPNIAVRGSVAGLDRAILGMCAASGNAIRSADRACAPRLMQKTPL